MKKSKPILFATLGFPGSGKTYFSRKFTKDFGFFHLNSDKVRSELFPRPKYTPKETATVFRLMDSIAGELLSRGKSVVYDANSVKREYRRRLQKIAKRQKAKYLLLWFKTPVGVALGRIKRRKELKSKYAKMYHKAVNPVILFRFKKYAEEPRREPFIIIDGEKPYAEQKKIVEKFLKLRQNK